jgi:hypothetical protein
MTAEDDGWRWANTGAIRVRYGGLMALDLKKQGETFTVTDAQVVKGGDADTVYTVRVLTRDDEQRLIEKIAKQCEKPEWDHELRRMEPKIDRRLMQAELQKAILDHILVDWSGIESEGEALPCTLDYKRMLPTDRQDGLFEIAKANAQVKGAALQATFRSAEDSR